MTADHASAPEDRAVRERIAAILSDLPEAHAVSQGAHSSLQVGARRFGWLLSDHHGDGRPALNCKSDEIDRDVLLKACRDWVHIPEYVGHHGWVGFWLDDPGVDWEVVRTALVGAYRMTAPKRLLLRLPPDA